jgi:hypothetical protein
VFSHEEQVARLASDVPEAAATAVLAGDPCFDRMLASVELREHYRQALGVHAGQRLVVVSSTWSTSSLLGSWPDLIPHLLAALPVDEFRVAAIVHPNVAQWHGRFQLRTWFADAIRAGLTLVPPLHGWQATLIAADVVIGDHGSVTTYGAGLSRPTLLAAFPDEAVVAGTAVHRLGQLAPRLARRAGLRGQVEDAVAGQDPQRYAPVTDLITAVPGQSARLLRELWYELLDLPEPAREAMLCPYPADGLEPPAEPRVAAMLVGCETDERPRTVRVERFPAESWPFLSEVPAAMRTHTVAHHRHPDRRRLANAEIVFGLDTDAGWRPETWLRSHPTCVLGATLHPGSCRVVPRGQDGWWLSVEPDDGGIDPSALASVALACLAAGIPPDGVDLRIGDRHARVVAT